MSANKYLQKIFALHGLDIHKIIGGAIDECNIDIEDNFFRGGILERARKLFNIFKIQEADTIISEERIPSSIDTNVVAALISSIAANESKSIEPLPSEVVPSIREDESKSVEPILPVIKSSDSSEKVMEEINKSSDTAVMIDYSNPEIPPQIELKDIEISMDKSLEDITPLQIKENKITCRNKYPELWNDIVNNKLKYQDLISKYKPDIKNKTIEINTNAIKINKILLYCHPDKCNSSDNANCNEISKMLNMLTTPDSTTSSDSTMLIDSTTSSDLTTSPDSASIFDPIISSENLQRDFRTQCIDAIYNLIKELSGSLKIIIPNNFTIPTFSKPVVTAPTPSLSTKRTRNKIFRRILSEIGSFIVSMPNDVTMPDTINISLSDNFISTLKNVFSKNNSPQQLAEDLLNTFENQNEIKTFGDFLSYIKILVSITSKQSQTQSQLRTTTTHIKQLMNGINPSYGGGFIVFDSEFNAQNMIYTAYSDATNISVHKLSILNYTDTSVDAFMRGIREKINDTEMLNVSNLVNDMKSIIKLSSSTHSSNIPTSSIPSSSTPNN